MRKKAGTSGGSRSRPSATYISNAERYSHINDVEHSKTTARYGTVEAAAPEVAKSVDHTAYSTVVRSTDTAAALPSESGRTDRQLVIRPTAYPVNHPMIGYSADYASAPSAEQSSGRLVGHMTASASSSAPEAAPSGNGVIKTMVGIAVRKAENTIGHADAEAGMTELLEGQAERSLYKSGKYAYLTGRGIGSGLISFGQYKAELSQAVAAGTLSRLEAKKLLRSRANSSAARVGTSVTETVFREVESDIEELRSSDELGTKAIMLPGNVVLGIRRTAQLTKATGHSIRNSISAAKRLGAKTKKLLSSINPASRRLVLLSAAALLLIILVSSIISAVFPALSLKSADHDLSESYLYVTKLDTDTEFGILVIEEQNPDIDEFYYYFNGQAVSREDMTVYTDADLILTYLDSKYEDYTYSARIETEIAEIHAALHSVETRTWERIEYVETSYTDPETGETVTETQEITIYCLDVYLQSVTWADYYEENKDTLLTPQQQEQYSALLEVGIYTFRKALASPFVGVDWSLYVSSRWGWRIHPISRQPAMHLGLDIAMPGGTPINACHGGTVQTGSDAGGLGNYVRIIMENGDYTEYGHMSSVAVVNGQTVSTGEVIGYVGTTGNSTGNHLHLAYYEDGRNINPWIVTECDSGN